MCALESQRHVKIMNDNNEIFYINSILSFKYTGQVTDVLARPPNNFYVVLMKNVCTVNLQ